MRNSDGPSKMATSAPAMRTFDAGDAIVVSASATTATRGPKATAIPRLAIASAENALESWASCRRRRAVHRQALHAGRDAEAGLHGSIASE